MAGDPLLAWVLLGLGLRDLSMAPRQIPLVKSIMRATHVADAERLLAQALTLPTETEIEELVYGTMKAQRFRWSSATARRNGRPRDRRRGDMRPSRAAGGLARRSRAVA